jgi:hypothetical protein
MFPISAEEFGCALKNAMMGEVGGKSRFGALAPVGYYYYYYCYY